MDKNYWMFRVRDHDYALDNNIVSYGWSDFKLGQERKEDFQKIKKISGSARAVSMARNFCKIQKGDIVLMPLWKNVAIGKIISDAIHSEDLKEKDEANTYEVEWLAKSYGRNNFSSALQSSLKYRGTFLNLWRYETDLERKIETGFKNIDVEYIDFCRNKRKKEIEVIADHINSNSKIKFSDNEFEIFIKDLFAINYGFEANLNSNKKEAIDGKDLTVSLDIDELETHLVYNIQVKQHEGVSNRKAIDQILKSDASANETKNVVVNTGRFNEDDKKYAEENSVILIDADKLAEMIYENFDKIDDEYKAKLNLYSSIRPVEK